MNLIVLVVMGAIFGAIARLLLKGDEGVSTLMTVVLGVLGAIAGFYIAAAFGVAHTKGIDWIRSIISVLCSMGFISLYVWFTNRGKTTPTL